MGRLMANHAARIDRGAGCRRRGSETRVRGDDGYEEDRRLRVRGGSGSPMSSCTVACALSSRLSWCPAKTWLDCLDAPACRDRRMAADAASTLDAGSTRCSGSLVYPDTLALVQAGIAP